MSVDEESQILTSMLTVTISGAEHNIVWSSDKTLVDVLIQENLDPPFSCLVGKCGACVCTVESGSVSMDANEVLDDGDVAENYVLGCQARPKTEVVAISF